MARSFADEMTIDPETGLPALPEDHAWKVERYSDRLYVQLVKRREFAQGFWGRLFRKTPDFEWGDVYVDGNKGCERVYDQTKAGVLHCASLVYDAMHEDAAKIDALDELVGLYPPKTIL